MHNKFLICAFLFINLIFLVYSDECAGEIKFYDKGGILVLKDNEICKFAWTSSMSFENCHYGCGDLDVHPIWNSGDGLRIIKGEVGEWNLENKFTFKTKSGRVCNKRMTRRVKIINGPENPCLKPNACGVNAKCEFDITQPMCKSCSCKFGCSGDPYTRCDDGSEMCRLFSGLCPSHTHCVEKACPEIFGCHCNAGYELIPTSAPKLDCKSENDCKFVPNDVHVCRDKNECTDRYNCPPNSHCVNDIYKGDGCGDSYPDKYPNHINSERCGYHCECDKGFSINDKTGQCEKKCDKECPPDAYCRFIDGIPTCVCKIPGHVYDTPTRKCVPIDKCKKDPTICEREKPNSHCEYTGPERYNCICNKGYREIRKDGRRICIKIGKCEQGQHNCHKNRRGGEVKRLFNKDVDVSNSYCEDDDSSKGYKCICEEGFDEFITSKGQYCLRRNNDEWKFELIGDNPMTLPHLTKHFIDPSYFFQILGPYKNAPHTKFPEAGLCSPLQTCGRFKVDYVLDTKDSALSHYPPHYSNDEELKRMFTNRIIPLDTRIINVWPINYCDENLSSYVDYVINPETKERFPLKERVEIELGRLNIRKCAKYASCRMNEARTLPEACGYSCPCWRNHQFTPFEPELFGTENECRYPKNPHIYFLRGYNATIPSTNQNRDLLKIDDLSNVNIFPMDGVCIVCEHKFGQQLDTIKIKDKLSAHTDDHKAFYPYPDLVKRHNGVYELNQVIYPEVRWEKIQITHVQEVDVSKLSKDTLYSFVKERELLEKCDYQKGCIAVYVVTYYTKEDGSDTQKRIVYTPIKNVELYIDKVRDIVYWWDKFYQILIIFLILASIYIAFLLFSRLYSCFQYFVLGKNDKNNARIAWDTVYLFRHPFNAQARNQLVYQALYMD